MVSPIESGPEACGRGTLPARVWAGDVAALHDDVELQRGPGDPFVVQGRHDDGIVANVPRLREGVRDGELAAGVGAQVQHLHLAVAPADAHVMVLDPLVRDEAVQRDLLEGKALGDRRGDHRHTFGDGLKTLTMK